MPVLAKLRKQDGVINLCLFLLTIISLVSVFSTTYSSTRPISADLIQQAFFLGFGFCIYLGITLIDKPLLLDSKSILIASLVTLLLLILVLVAGETVFGTKRWFVIGELSFQPSEFAKLTLIVIIAGIFKQPSLKTASLLALKSWRIKSITKLPQLKQVIKLNWRVFLAIFTCIASILLIWAQPSLGNAVITAAICFLTIVSLVKRQTQLWVVAVILILGVNLGTGRFSLAEVLSLAPTAGTLVTILVSLLIIVTLTRFSGIRAFVAIAILLLGCVIGAGWQWGWQNILSSYQQERITAYLNPESDPLGAYWQVNQAQIAIASGQIWGKGLLQGTQSNLGLLPFAYTDFAYAALAEQFGFWGCLIIIGIYLILVQRIIYIANSSSQTWDKVVCAGIASMLSLNVLVNIGMNLGLLPVTGVPLPFISYGGSAVLVNFIGLGLVQLVYTNIKTKSINLLK